MTDFIHIAGTEAQRINYAILLTKVNIPRQSRKEMTVAGTNGNISK